jgi:hypothetical protein
MENCFFYISRTYEFLHRLGQSRRFQDVRDMSGAESDLRVHAVLVSVYS